VRKPLSRSKVKVKWEQNLITTTHIRTKLHQFRISSFFSVLFRRNACKRTDPDKNNANMAGVQSAGNDVKFVKPGFQSVVMQATQGVTAKFVAKKNPLAARYARNAINAVVVSGLSKG